MGVVDSNLVVEHDSRRKPLVGWPRSDLRAERIVPDDESRYLYERLYSGEFQQLVSALLAHKDPDFRRSPSGRLR